MVCIYCLPLLIKKAEVSIVKVGGRWLYLCHYQIRAVVILTTALKWKFSGRFKVWKTELWFGFFGFFFFVKPTSRVTIESMWRNPSSSFTLYYDMYWYKNFLSVVRFILLIIPAVVFHQIHQHQLDHHRRLQVYILFTSTSFVVLNNLLGITVRAAEASLHG